MTDEVHSFEDQNLRQETIWNMPEGLICGLQMQNESGKWQPLYSILSNMCVTEKEALEQLSYSSPGVRMVEYSRYLVEGELVVIKIIKVKRV